jgi:hypothetical protein
MPISGSSWKWRKGWQQMMMTRAVDDKGRVLGIESVNGPRLSVDDLVDVIGELVVAPAPAPVPASTGPWDELHRLADMRQGRGPMAFRDRNEYGVQHDNLISVKADGQAFLTQDSAEAEAERFNAMNPNGGCGTCLDGRPVKPVRHYVVFRTVRVSDWRGVR